MLRITPRRALLAFACALSAPLAAAPVAAAITPKNGLYHGLTAQGKNGTQCFKSDPDDPFETEEVPCEVSFRVKKGVVRDARFMIAWDSCSTEFPLSPFTDRVKKNGRFRVTEQDSFMRGRFTSRTRVRGQVSGKPNDRSPGCSGTQVVSFTATRQ